MRVRLRLRVRARVRQGEAGGEKREGAEGPRDPPRLLCENLRLRLRLRVRLRLRARKRECPGMRPLRRVRESEQL
jgi:hypothetical protein